MRRNPNARSRLSADGTAARGSRRAAAGLGGCAVIVSMVLVAAGCVKAPGTARNQIMFISEEKEMALGISAYRNLLRQARLSANPEINAMVHRVGRRIAAAANKPEYYWEFAVIQDDGMVNAFALPGGKVAIYTGILRHAKNEAGLATVMAHEIAHALQRHGAERMSRGLIDQIARIGAIAGAVSGQVDPQLAMGAMSAYGVGVTLPHNRSQESEADKIGLILMAKAGYDPREAIGFWERMSGCPKQMIGKFCFRSNASVPEFLSTHPSDATRIRQIEAWIPEALRHYQPVRENPDQEPTPSSGPAPSSTPAS